MISSEQRVLQPENPRDSKFLPALGTEEGAVVEHPSAKVP